MIALSLRHFTRSAVLLAMTSTSFSQEPSDKSNTEAISKPQECWTIAGESGIRLNLEKEGVLPYADNIEMSGRRVSGVISYAIDKDGGLEVTREIFFPQLHEFKTSEDTWFHDYRAYLQDQYGDDLLPKLYHGDEQFAPGPVSEVAIDGILSIRHAPSKSGLALTRVFFPSMDERLFLEKWNLRNTTKEPMTLRTGHSKLGFEDYGARGKFIRKVSSDAPEQFGLEAGEEVSFSISIAAVIEGEAWPAADSDAELGKRQKFLGEMAGALQLKTPDPILNTLFRFSKIRASESIFESDLGLIHSPGGGRYYVGIWANDQAEYINPFFAFLGYGAGNESAMNCFRAFAKETNPQYEKIRYSFEIEGLVKPFHKDRGDAAMIAYGAAQYALISGNEETARELWPLIDWCLEYCHRNLNEEGVVMSESDEMEGRIETGTANLSTSSLYYGALDHAIDLAGALGLEASRSERYREQQGALKTAIEAYFGATLEGLETYKYYKEHQHLRHWICLPLVVGIHDRSKDTIRALFENLWTDNGVHVEKNSGNEAISKIFWDRGTLYALRGTLIAGEIETSLAKLKQFSTKRLIGDRVPYVVEAYPEGDMAHLSAESGLYCRVFLEGLFGINPTGLRSFEITPRLPEGWDRMSLKHIKGFGDDFNLEVERKGKSIQVTLSRGGNEIETVTMEPGDTREFILER